MSLLFSVNASESPEASPLFFLCLISVIASMMEQQVLKDNHNQDSGRSGV